MCYCHSKHCLCSLKPTCIWCFIPCLSCTCEYDVNSDFIQSKKDPLLQPDHKKMSI